MEDGIMRRICFATLAIFFLFVFFRSFAQELGEGSGDPEPRQELQDPDDCDHDFPSPGEGEKDPSARVTLYYKGATTSIPDDHVIERILNGEKVELEAHASFSSGIAGRNSSWEKDGAETTLQETYTWEPQGSGSEATFTPNAKGKKTIKVTYKKSVRQRFKVTVRCPHCGETKQVDKEVTAEATASDSVPYNVYALKIQAKRTGSAAAYGSSATIGAGPYASDVHRADLEFSLDPEGPPSSTLTFPLSVTNGHGADVANQKISAGYTDTTGTIISASSIDDAGEGTGSVSFNTTQAKRYGKMTPTNFNGRNTQISSTASDASLSVSSGWGTTGTWKYSEEFYSNVWEPVSHDLALDGEPLDGHSVKFEPTEVGGHWFDPLSMEWTSFTITEEDTLYPWRLYTQFASTPESGGLFTADATVTSCAKEGSGGCSHAETHASDCPGGRAQVYQIVYANFLYVVEEVKFKAHETAVYYGGQ